MMCFKPKDVPSKKVVLVELERAKVGLEQENSVLKIKLRDLQASTARTTKERDVLSTQRTELDSQLQQRSSHASHLLTQVTCLRSNLTSRLQELLDQHLAAVAEANISKAKSEATNTANVHVIQQDDTEDEQGSGLAAVPADVTATALKAYPDPTQTQPGFAGLSIPDDAMTGDSDTKLSVQHLLDLELEVLAKVHERALERAAQLYGSVRHAEGAKSELRREVASARRRLEQAEANAETQQQVLQLRCAALEQENEQLTGLNEELQQRLEGALGDLSAAKKQWSSDGAQLAKQAADLEASNGRLREAEAELRALHAQLAAATMQGQETSAKLQELHEQAAARAASLDAAGSTLAAREAELATATGRIRDLEAQMQQHQQAHDALVAELWEMSETLLARQREMDESKKAAAAELEEVRSQFADSQRELATAQGQLAGTRRDLATAQHQVAHQAQALLDANAQLQENRVAVAVTSDRLNRALEELGTNETRLSEATMQYMNTKQSVISTAKQLASMAKEHSANLAKLHAAEVELASLREQLEAVAASEAALRAQANASSAAAREAREAAEAAGAEARRLRVAYDSASADLRRKIMLLTAIARMADKGQGAAAGGRSGREGGQTADSVDGYGAVTSEQRLRLKICESPLPLLGALTAGIMDSSRLRHLALDMDTSREVTWEKAGLRICCLAAAIGLNNSLQTLQLGGWTWGELGNGTALPFLALGGGAGAGGGGGMLRSVQLATNLFDLEAAAMLKDLMAAGLVELAAGGAGTVEGEDGSGGGGGGGGGQRPGGGGGAGQGGVLYLYSGNERLDIWYSDMLLLAGPDSRPQASSAAATSAGGTAPGSPGPPSAAASCRTASSGGGALSHSASLSSVTLSAASASTLALDVGPRTSAMSTSASIIGGGRGNCPPPAGGGSAAASVASPSLVPPLPAVDCDLSSEALESHHIVLVMTVLLTCPGMKRLRLDGNKLGDGGAALLALGLATNTGLKELYLGRNGIRAAGARSLARCLEGANSTLLRLDLSGQRQLEGIGAAGAEAMAQALRVNRTLEELNLSSCGLGGGAAACFVGAIRAAGALRPRSPQDGGASPAGAGSGSSTACTSGGGGGGSLRRLLLSGNGVDGATSNALLAAAAKRPGLMLSL